MTHTDLGVPLRLEIQLRLTGATWLADLLECTENEVRARLRPGELGTLPSWPCGTAVDCALTTSRRDYFADAVVAGCAGPVVRLEITEEFRSDRRRPPRALAAFVVAYSGGQCTGLGRCSDIGEGGMCLHVHDPLWVGAPLFLGFAMPGGPGHVCAEGLVASVRPADQGGWLLGVEFTSMGPVARDAVRHYCRSSAGW